MAKRAEKRAPGRPSTFTPAIAAEICERLGKGEPLEAICRDAHMPPSRTVHGWVNDKERPAGVPETFSTDFAQARARGFDAIAAECLVIADDASNDWMEKHTREGESAGWQLNGEHVQRSKLRIDTRLKLLAKWDPKRYGEKLAVGGAEDLPPVKADISINEVARRLAFTLYKGMKAAQAGQLTEGAAGGDDADVNRTRRQVRKP